MLRRERLGGLGPTAYLASKLVVLTLLVLVQSGLLVGVLAATLQMPAHGILVPAAVEIYVTVVLCGIAGVALGLALSAIASTPDKAMSLIPIVLVPQVLFAGLMFQLTGVTKLISWAVSSRPGVDALSAIVSLNDLPSPLPLPYEPEHAHTAAILLVTWATLAAHVLVFSALARWKLRE